MGQDTSTEAGPEVIWTVVTSCVLISVGQSVCLILGAGCLHFKGPELSHQDSGVFINFGSYRVLGFPYS